MKRRGKPNRGGGRFNKPASERGGRGRGRGGPPGGRGRGQGRGGRGSYNAVPPPQANTSAGLSRKVDMVKDGLDDYYDDVYDDEPSDFQ